MICPCTGLAFDRVHRLAGRGPCDPGRLACPVIWGTRKKPRTDEPDRDSPVPARRAGFSRRPRCRIPVRPEEISAGSRRFDIRRRSSDSMLPDVSHSSSLRVQVQGEQLTVHSVEGDLQPSACSSSMGFRKGSACSRSGCHDPQAPRAAASTAGRGPRSATASDRGRRTVQPGLQSSPGPLDPVVKTGGTVARQRACSAARSAWILRERRSRPPPRCPPLHVSHFKRSVDPERETGAPEGRGG